MGSTIKHSLPVQLKFRGREEDVERLTVLRVTLVGAFTMVDVVDSFGHFEAQLSLGIHDDSWNEWSGVIRRDGVPLSVEGVQIFLDTPIGVDTVRRSNWVLSEAILGGILRSPAAALNETAAAIVHGVECYNEETKEASLPP
jgi:hypothetical protein